MAHRMLTIAKQGQEMDICVVARYVWRWTVPRVSSNLTSVSAGSVLYGFELTLGSVYDRYKTCPMNVEERSGHSGLLSLASSSTTHIGMAFKSLFAAVAAALAVVTVQGMSESTLQEYIPT